MLHQNFKSRVKATPALKRLALAAMRNLAALSWRIRPDAVIRYGAFLRDWRRFLNAGGKAEVLDFFPCLFDKTSTTGIDTHYFHQAIWAFRHVRQSGAARHIDVASDVNFVGLLTTITDVVFVDIRPLLVRIPNYHGVSASVTCLPFADGSLASLSCMHVLEHIGLGRYGDPIDPRGPEKACREIERVLQAGGNAYVSVPIGRARVCFNGQRVFAVSEVRALFASLELHDMAIVDVPGNFIDHVAPESVDIREAEGGSDFGLGMFRFGKPIPISHPR